MKRTIYVVVRENWYYNDEENVLGAERLLKAFVKREAAQEYLDRCRIDEQARQLHCPDHGDNHFVIVEMQATA